MSRSHRWILLFIFMAVSGIAMTGGIVAYNNIFSAETAVFNSGGDRLNSNKSSNNERGGAARIFTFTKADISRIVLYSGGKMSLDITPNTLDLSTWDLNGDRLLQVDQKKLNRYIEELLNISFSAKQSANNYTLKELGLDYPRYELRFTLHNGDVHSLSVGGRLPGTTASYGIIDYNIRSLGVLRDQLTLLQQNNRNFFVDNIFNIEQAGVTDFYYFNSQRPLKLYFVKNGANWELNRPYVRPAHPAEFQALLTNLLHLNALAYIDAGDMKYLNLNSTEPQYIFVIGQGSKKNKLEIYTDKLGNYYGRIDDKEFMCVLPESLNVLINKPVNFFLTSLFDLPDFDEVGTIQVDYGGKSVVFHKKGNSWRRGESPPDENMQSALKVWYNNLAQTTIISTADRPQDIISSYSCYIQTDRGKSKILEWHKINSEAALLWIDGKDTGVVTKLPPWPAKLQLD